MLTSVRMFCLFPDWPLAKDSRGVWGGPRVVFQIAMLKFSLFRCFSAGKTWPYCAVCVLWLQREWDYCQPRAPSAITNEKLQPLFSMLHLLFLKKSGVLCLTDMLLSWTQRCTFHMIPSKLSSATGKIIHAKQKSEHWFLSPLCRNMGELLGAVEMSCI